MLTWANGLALTVAMAVATPIFIQWVCGWPRGAKTFVGNFLDALGLSSIEWRCM